MNSPLTYPDQQRDEIKAIGAFLKKVLIALLICLFDVLA